jgi:dipeptidyl aminopeptidase/acylaminoacyl peptidase
VHDFDQYFATRRYHDLTIRPDGEEVAYATDISGNYNVWRQSAEGGWPYQLTGFLERAVRRVAWSPDGTRLAVAADRDGDEKEQIFVLPARGGTARRLAPRDDVRYLLGDQPWAPDGRTLACACNSEDEANFDLVQIDVETGAVRRLSEEPHFHTAHCWSPDGRLLCGTITRSNMHQDVVIADREAGALSCVTAARPAAQRQPLGFSADGSSLYLLTDEGREFKGLARFDLESAEIDWLKVPDWDVDLARMSADGRWILFVINEDAVHRVHLLDRNSGREPPVTPLPMGKCEGLALAADGSRAAILHSASVRPAEVAVLDFARGGLRTITHGMIGGIPPEDMVEPEICRLASFDRKIPAQLYRPTGDPPESGFPAVLHVHGGPEAQEQPLYQPLYQYLVSRGFVVLAPNIRGSTGYGQAYQKLILRDFGGDDLRDLDAAARFLKSLPQVDGQRLAVAGGSYGGFAALSCATRLPEHWAAAVDVCGPSNLVTFAQSVPKSWQRFMRDWVGDPREEKDELLRRSPITYVDRLRCPLLVVQGAHDPRCVQAESDQMVARIRERGGTVDYLVFEDEGHGFLKTENQVRAFRAIGEFLLRHVGKG